MNKLFSLILSLALLSGCCGKKDKAEKREDKKVKRTVVKEVTPADVDSEPMVAQGPFVYEEEINLETAPVAMPEEDL